MSEITMLVPANRAEISNGNLYGLGIGWNWATEHIPTFDLVVRTLVAPARLEGGEISWQCTLVDPDGRPVPGPDQVGVEVHASGTMPGGNYMGTEVPVWTIFRFPSFQLTPGRYQLRVTVDDDSKEYPFTVVPAQAS